MGIIQKKDNWTLRKIGELYIFEFINYMALISLYYIYLKVKEGLIMFYLKELVVYKYSIGHNFFSS